MTSERDSSEAARIRADATDWFVRLHADPGDAAPRQAFEQWRDGDPRHAASYARVQRLWGASGHLASLSSPPHAIDRRQLLRRSAVAAAGLGVAIGGGRLVLGPHPLADHSTRTGERRAIALADGSTVDLATSSALDVRFNKAERLVHLLDGEAYFRVARDGRPFRVAVGAGSVTALGTAFAIDHAGPATRVTVTEHAAQVTVGGRSLRLNAGNMLSFRGAVLGDTVAADMNALAWRDGRLAFSGQPLGDVVAVLNRWTTNRIVLLDEALHRRPVTLMIALSDADHAIERLGAVVPMRIMRFSSLLTVVRAA